jgi:predicted acetyltransferase
VYSHEWTKQENQFGTKRIRDTQMLTALKGSRMVVDLIEAEIGEREIVERLFDQYADELSSFTNKNIGSVRSKPINYSLLDEYWKDEKGKPYLITYNGAVAGFSLLRRYPSDLNLYDFGQFFVLKEYRGKGIAKEAVRQCVLNHHGKWLVRVLPDNLNALSFWLSVVNEISSGNYSNEVEIDVDIPMHFIRFEAVGN